MYCLVDFRNRPQFGYTFRTRDQAREYLQKIKNNPFGITLIHLDGRREYFENGLPAKLFFQKGLLLKQNRKKFRLEIKKGCDVKYQVKRSCGLDALKKYEGPSWRKNNRSWKSNSVQYLFMLGNRKVYASLAIASLIFFSFSIYFQNYYSQDAVAYTENLDSFGGRVAGVSFQKDFANEKDSVKLADEEIILNLLQKIEEEQQEEFSEEIRAYIKGRPMEAMAPYIAKEDRMVAAFIVGIAMKESKFGVYAPHKGGRDCYNYWGYKGRENPTASGYSCFNSPEHAIQVVGKRISKLVEGGISNPAEMISWKCGSTCSWDNPENVRKWIADVGIYFRKINS